MQPRRIHLSPPDAGEIEQRYVLAALDGGWLAPVGPDLTAFEEELAGRCARAHGVGLASGTAALHLTLRELGVGPGDEVLVSTFTFAASANAVVHCGAVPVFVDSDASTWNINPDLLAEAIDDRRRAGARVVAAVIVDLYGRCADYDRIAPALAERDVVLVSDAAEALGATHQGRPAGSFGVAAVLSFNGNKIVTTSGGGAVVTDDAHLAGRVRHLATQAREPAPHYEHVEVGWNERLSNILAALGRAQLSTLGDRIARRRAVRERYVAALGDLPGVGFNPVHSGVNHWLTCITIDPATGVTPERVRQALERADIEARPAWKPMHRQPVYASASAYVDGTSDQLFARGLCLPSGSNLDERAQARVIERIRDVFACVSS